MTSDHSKISTSLRVGIDIGGTFTDFVLFNPSSGKISTFKIPSTPQNPAEAVLLGIQKLLKEQPPDTNPTNLAIIHGSTVATNALLERKGANTALVTTQGFKDVIQIGRQNRPALYDFAGFPPEPLVPPELRFEMDERMDPSGKAIRILETKSIDQLLHKINEPQVAIESIAVVFLFSFANPTHEQMVTQQLRKAGYFVSPSFEILPEYREYERTSTTVVNAYVSPVLDRYLKKLEDNLPDGTPLQIMQSNGGSISLGEARKSGVRCILSGPAGGVVGCQFIGETLRKVNKSVDQITTAHPKSPLRLLTFDMGGTSTDVSLIDEQPQVTSEASVGGLPIRIPVLDIHTIGAGGGSIAYVDVGGALRVGPESAGADPGPACYGKHRQANFMPVATVTDANLWLGRIPPEKFLGGEMPLHLDLAEAAIQPLASKLGLSLTETALGILEITNAHMERALRVISVERGHDPREFTLLSFGGAGSLHAADLAQRLQIPRVLIPPYAATLSAFGMLAANVVKDYTQTVMLSGDTPFSTIQSQIDPLQTRAISEISNDGIKVSDIQIEPALDMRYRGQSYELTIPFTQNFVEDFHKTHQQTYGYQRIEASLEIVNIRVRGTGLVASPEIEAQPLRRTNPLAALLENRSVVLSNKQTAEIPFYQGEKLLPGNFISGPAVIVRNDTTIFMRATDTASVDPYLNIIMEIQS